VHHSKFGRSTSAPGQVRRCRPPPPRLLCPRLPTSCCTLDHLLRLAVEEELGRRRPGRDGVNGDVPAAQLLGENAGHGLDRRLGGGIDAVSRLQQAGDARGKGDERPRRSRSMSAALGSPLVSPARSAAQVAGNPEERIWLVPGGLSQRAAKSWPADGPPGHARGAGESDRDAQRVTCPALKHDSTGVCDGWHIAKCVGYDDGDVHRTSTAKRRPRRNGAEV
jgi:hypothetical protein